MLSISQARTRVQKYVVHYTFQQMSTITEKSGCDTILQEYYITDSRNCESTKRYTSMYSTKGAYKLQKEKLERRAGGLEG